MANETLRYDDAIVRKFVTATIAWGAVALLVIVSSLLVWSIGSREGMTIWIDRVHGPTFVELPDGKIASQVRIKLENESDETRHYSITLHRDVKDAMLRAGQLVFEVRPRKSIEVPLFVDAPRASYVHGKRTATLRIGDDRGFARIVTVNLFGPEGGAR